MRHILVVVCSGCGGFLLAKSEQRRRTCPYCGSKVAIDKAKKVGSAKTAQEASMILRKLKGDAAQKPKHAN